MLPARATHSRLFPASGVLLALSKGSHMFMTSSPKPMEDIPSSETQSVTHKLHPCSCTENRGDPGTSRLLLSLACKFHESKTLAPGLEDLPRHT